MDLWAGKVHPVGPVMGYLLVELLSISGTCGKREQRWVKCLLGVFALTSANPSEAVPGVCCGAWVFQEMVRAFGNLAVSHDVDTYPVLRFPARSPVWSRGDELSPGAGTNPAGVLSFLCDL